MYRNDVAKIHHPAEAGSALRNIWLMMLPYMSDAIHSFHASNLLEIVIYFILSHIHAPVHCAHILYVGYLQAVYLLASDSKQFQPYFLAWPFFVLGWLRKKRKCNTISSTHTHTHTLSRRLILQFTRSGHLSLSLVPRPPALDGLMRLIFILGILAVIHCQVFSPYHKYNGQNCRVMRTNAYAFDRPLNKHNLLDRIRSICKLDWDSPR